ncbi:GIP [Symbiodinium sp. CCMP2592]|nr:GIP [Symbiodinium sp. CCMP2592]
MASSQKFHIAANILNLKSCEDEENKDPAVEDEAVDSVVGLWEPSEGVRETLEKAPVFRHEATRFLHIVASEEGSHFKCGRKISTSYVRCESLPKERRVIQVEQSMLKSLHMLRPRLLSPLGTCESALRDQMRDHPRAGTLVNAPSEMYLKVPTGGGSNMAASYSDSRSVFDARVDACGLPREDAAKVKAAVGSLRQLAFISSFTPGQADEAPLMAALKSMLGRDAELAVQASLRALYHEAYAIVTSEMRQKIEKSEEPTARRLTQPERAERHEKQVAKSLCSAQGDAIAGGPDKAQAFCCCEKGRLTLVAEPVFRASENGVDVPAPNEADPWQSQDPWARWRTETAEVTNDTPTTPTDETTAEASDDHHNGNTADNSGWESRSGPGGGTPGPHERPRWSDAAWREWLQGTWKPEFGGQVDDNYGTDGRRTSTTSADSNGATGATATRHPPKKWWEGGTDWSREQWHGTSWTWAADPGAASTRTSTSAPTNTPATRFSATLTAWTSTRPTDGGERPAGGPEGGGGKGPSEKLIIPSFSGDGEGAELGTSARSYLRQVDAWERMTKLAPSQRALVLYQHLEGAAWINAEALSMEALSSADGVGYLRQWVQQHYLDVEVTSVGRSLSDLFRKLKRRYNQSFRDYTAEFNRLLARVVECGCKLPDVATAWLYVDRASLDEATEVSLLASVGNKYQLLQLQQAAIILDRSMRKPWEKSGKPDGARRPQTVHHTEDAENNDGPESDEEPPTEDVPGEDGEALYVAYMTAKARYKDTTRARGIDIDAVKKTAEERIKAAKARSYCSVCHQKGHWHRDACCPKRKPEVQTVNVAHELDSLRPAASLGLQAITDSACSKSVVGTTWLQGYLNMVRNQGKVPELISEREAFRFGASRVYESTYATVILFYLGSAWVAVKAAVIHGDIPLLLSKPCLAKLGMVMDLEHNTADFRKLGITGLQLLTTPTGHPAVAVCHKGKSLPDPSALPKAWGPDGTEIIAEAAQVYMTVVAGQGQGEGPGSGVHQIFYEKKVDEAARAMLVGDHLCHATFLQWWRSTTLTPISGRPKAHCNAIYYNRPLEAFAKHGGSHAAAGVRLAPSVTCGGTRNLRATAAATQLYGSAAASSIESDLTACSFALLVMSHGKATWTMNKTQLLAECTRRSLAVDPKWTVTELRHVLAGDSKHYHYRESPPEVPKSISKMTRDELVSEAEKLGIEVGTKDPKGAIMMRIRDHAAPDTTMMTIGRFRGESFVNIPDSYGDWASEEERINGDNMHPEMKRYVTWRRNHKARKSSAGYINKNKARNYLDVEASALIPPPPISETGASSSAVWDMVEGMGNPPSATAKATSRPTRRPLEEDKNARRMERDVEPHMLEEIRNLEEGTIIPESDKDFYPKNPVHDTTEAEGGSTRTATVFAAEEAIIPENDEDFYPKNLVPGGAEANDQDYESCESSESAVAQEALYTKHDAQECLVTEFGYKDGVTGGEEMARRALQEERFGDEDVETILDACEFGHRRDRPGVHAQGVEERCVLGYYAFGKFHGVTKRSGAWSYLTRYLNRFLQVRCGAASSTWTSLSICLNAPAGIHTDRTNLPGSLNVMWTGGQHRGGGLWIADKEGTEIRRDDNGEYVAGKIIETKGRITSFDPKCKHASEPWTGRRWSVVGYVARSFPYASKVSKRVLSKLDFPVPTATDLRCFREANVSNHQRESNSRRPRKSVQRGLWKNAAAISMMMTTALATMSSFAMEYTEPRAKPRVAILEVGDVTATCYAAGICPEGGSVAEPMLYSDLEYADKLTDCNFGPIEVGTIKHEPGELWLHVTRDWLATDVKEDAEQAMDRQLRDGRSVVLQRGASDIGLWEDATSGWEDAGYTVDYDIDQNGNEYVKVSPAEDDPDEPYVIYAADAVGERDGVKPDRDGARSWAWICSMCMMSRATHELLSIVDYSSAYQVVIPVARKDTPHIERAFCEGWANIFGAPEVVTVDLENGLQKALAKVGDWAGMRIKSAAGQAHWQAGFVERHGGIWKSMFSRVNEEMSVVKGEIHLATMAVSSAKNHLTRSGGYSPQQHVFGTTPRVPEDLLEGPHARSADDGPVIDDKHAREVAIRTSARVAYHHVQTDERVRRAGVLLPEDAKRGMWVGPGTVIGEEGTNIWVSKGGRCVLCAEEHVRLATPEELGQAFSMRVAREDLERLLGGDPEDEEIYGDDEGDANGHGGADLPSDLDDILDEMSLPDEVAYDMEAEDEEARGAKTERSKAKQLEKEIPWSQIPDEVRPLFIEAERKQWNEHLEHKALEIMDIQSSLKARAEVPRERILPSRYAYRDKAMGKRKACPETPWRAKARLVVGGHLDPDLGGGLTTDSPTINRSSLIMLLQLAASLRWELAAGDIQAAFQRELFMEQPRGGVEGLDPRQLLRIRKGIFGLAESPRMWYDRLNQVLTEETFVIDGVNHRLRPCPLDPCVYLLQAEGEPRPRAYIGIHVDDLIILAPREVRLALQEKISALFPVDSWESEEFDYIGSSISVKDGTVKVNQAAFVEGRLFTVEVPKNQEGDQPATEEQMIDNKSLIGALSWLASQSRPDLLCPVALAQQLQRAPTTDDVRFTNTTALRAEAHKDKGLTLHPVDLNRAVIVVYHDAAWANAEHEEAEPGFELKAEEIQSGNIGAGLYSDKRPRLPKRARSKLASQLGHLVCLCDRDIANGARVPVGILEWRSNASKRVCRSTFGAETMSAVEALEAAQYLRALMATLVSGRLVKHEQAAEFCPILALTDCKSLHDFLHRAGQPRLPSDRRLAIDLAALRQDLRAEVPAGAPQQKGIPFRWIPTTLQMADVLTKPRRGDEWWSMLEEGIQLPFADGTLSLCSAQGDAIAGGPDKAQAFCCCEKRPVRPLVSVAAASVSCSQQFDSAYQGPFGAQRGTRRQGRTFLGNLAPPGSKKLHRNERRGHSGKLKVENKDAEDKASTASEVHVLQALQRRSLALDQANLVEYTLMQQWSDRLLRARMDDPPPQYSRPSWSQLVAADKKLFSELRDLTRDGVQSSSGGARPLDKHLPAVMMSYDVVCLLQPMPQSASGRSSDDSGKERPAPYTPKGPRKGAGKGKEGKGKGRMPAQLIAWGCTSSTKKGNPYCYGFQLGNCQNAVTNNACVRGLHACAIPKCGQHGHGASTCPKRKQE